MKTKIIAVILAVLAAGSAAAYFLTKDKKADPVPQETAQSRVFSLTSSAYNEKITVTGTDSQIYLPTDKEGLYYTADLNNNIDFYVLSGGAFQKAAYEKKTAKVNLTASNETVPVTLTYIDADGLTVGYGVFTSAMSSSVKLYDYAFCKIAKKSSGYGDGYWLLTDFTKDDFYKADKVYNEMYNYKVGQGSVATAVSQNTRLIDENATYRQDWTLLTDEFIRNLGSANYFMSSRYYTSEETGKRTDIMVYSNAYRPKIQVKDIIGYWFVNDEDGMHYLKTDGNGFRSVVKKDDKESTVVKFEDSYDNYLRSGNYVLNTSTAVMTNLITGEETVLKDVDANGATAFSLNKNVTKAVIAFDSAENSNNQKLIYYSFDDSFKTETFVEPMLFEEKAGFVWLEGSGNTVMSVRALSDDGAKTGSVTYTFSQK